MAEDYRSETKFPKLYGYQLDESLKFLFVRFRLSQVFVQSVVLQVKVFFFEIIGINNFFGPIKGLIEINRLKTRQSIDRS